MSRIKMPTFSVRYDEQQLLDIAAKARVQSSKKSYLHKSDPKLKKLTQRWCCVFQNMLFYFESESVTKPLGVVMLEGCQCKAVEQIGQSTATEGAFYICSSEGQHWKSHYFIAKNDRERAEWIDVLSNANMSRVRQQLEDLRSQCDEYSHILTTRNSEVQHLKQANLQAQQDVEHLRGALRCSTLSNHRSSNPGPSPSPFPSTSDSPDSQDQNARVLQGHIRSWLRRRRWKKIVREYMDSPLSSVMKTRNQLMWRFVASEEDYVSQLTILNDEYRQQFEIAAASRKPPLTLKQSNDIFRNSNEILLLHQMILRGLHCCIDKWPVVIFGDLLKLVTPMFSIYHKFVGDHTHAYELLLTLLSEASFKEFLDSLQKKLMCKDMCLDSLLSMPLKRISSYIKDLQDLCAHMIPEHVDYAPFSETIQSLETTQKLVMDEVCQSETIRRVLKVESMLEGGCRELLDKEQTLIKQGMLQQVRMEPRMEEKNPLTTISLPRPGSGKLNAKQRYCFLFSKHLLITTRISKKPNDCYKTVKILPLIQCHVSEYRQSDVAEVVYRGLKVNCDSENELDSILLLGTSINEKAEWIADITQCVENEKQNKILQSQSIGEPVELSSKFIRYSTFRTGKEQLVNSGNLDNLLDRLIKIGYFGLDFLNTFLMTFPLFTDPHTVFDFLEKNYWECMHSREKRRGSVTPLDAVRDARAVQSQSFPRSVLAGTNTPAGRHLTIPGKSTTLPVNLSPHSGNTSPPSPLSLSPANRRKISDSGGCGGVGEWNTSSTKSVSGILFALKQWICKHFFHFREDVALSEKLEGLINHATHWHMMNASERNVAMEVDSMYKMQKEAMDEISPVMELKLSKDVHLPQKPFECVLLWNPRETAEQLCLIEGALFQRIGNDEILRYFTVKGEAKAKKAPNLHAIFEHFNRMSLFFMWSLPNQRYFVDRVKVLEFLIQLAWECYQLHNFSSLMQLTSALEHGSTGRFKTVWEQVSKQLKLQFQQLVQLSSTDNRFKELRSAMKNAPPPTVPYLGILLSEMSGVVEGLPTYLEESLVNFSKMRRCVRLISSAMQHQKDPYEFTFVPEVCRVLLHTSIPGNEDDLYRFVDNLDEK